MQNCESFRKIFFKFYYRAKDYTLYYAPPDVRYIRELSIETQLNISNKGKINEKNDTTGFICYLYSYHGRA